MALVLRRLGFYEYLVRRRYPPRPRGARTNAATLAGTQYNLDHNHSSATHSARVGKGPSSRPFSSAKSHIERSLSRVAMSAAALRSVSFSPPDYSFFVFACDNQCPCDHCFMSNSTER